MGKRFLCPKGHLFVRDDVGRTEKKTDKYSFSRFYLDQLRCAAVL